MNAEQLLTFAKTLPGFYGYRPTLKGDVIHIEELQFHLFDDEEACEYILHVFLDEEKVVDYLIDVRYSDGSMARVLNNDPDFKDILEHKDYVVKLLTKKVFS